jgi:hypothetical protein
MKTRRILSTVAVTCIVVVLGAIVGFRVHCRGLLAKVCEGPTLVVKIYTMGSSGHTVRGSKVVDGQSVDRLSGLVLGRKYTAAFAGGLASTAQYVTIDNPAHPELTVCILDNMIDVLTPHHRYRLTTSEDIEAHIRGFVEDETTKREMGSATGNEAE